MSAGLAAALAILALPPSPSTPRDGTIDVPSFELQWVEAAPARKAS